MRAIYWLLVLLTVVLMISGCANPYLSPNTSAAIHDRLTVEELQKQTAELQKQTSLLERIAAASEHRAGIAPPK
jgi:PBP1b-binding outer membrane lipoprotein LpoB